MSCNTSFRGSAIIALHVFYHRTLIHQKFKKGFWTTLRKRAFLLVQEFLQEDFRYRFIVIHVLGWRVGPRSRTLVGWDESAETLDYTYYHRVPLPSRIPGYHKLDKQARLADVHDRHASTTYAHVASNTWHARFTSLLWSISKTGPSNYYARLQALHNSSR